jgi:hypothetical protein
MNRRGFLRLLGIGSIGAAGMAVASLLPDEPKPKKVESGYIYAQYIPLQVSTWYDPEGFSLPSKLNSEELQEWYDQHTHVTSSGPVGPSKLLGRERSGVVLDEVNFVVR